MPIKLATPAPLTFELRRDPWRDPCFYAVERPELSIALDNIGQFRVVLCGNITPPAFNTPELAETYANDIHARLCTFEQPQSEEAPAEPVKRRWIVVNPLNYTQFSTEEDAKAVRNITDYDERIVVPVDLPE